MHGRKSLSSVHDARRDGRDGDVTADIREPDALRIALHKTSPIRITRILADNGKEFTDRLFAKREPGGN